MGISFHLLSHLFVYGILEFLWPCFSKINDGGFFSVINLDHSFTVECRDGLLKLHVFTIAKCLHRPNSGNVSPKKGKLPKEIQEQKQISISNLQSEESKSSRKEPKGKKKTTKKKKKILIFSGRLLNT